VKELAHGVFQLGGFPPNAVNVYLVGDVVIDAGGRPDRRRILKQVRGRGVKAHAITHAHPDHQGASHAICTELGIPYWVPEGDADAAEDPRLIRERQPAARINDVMHKVFTGPAHHVDRRLGEGDDVAGFQVLHTPGHSRGHVCFWRERDRVLICGDVMSTANSLTLMPGFTEPFRFFTPDPAQNRASLKRVLDLEPALIAPGHGPPSRDRAKIEKFRASLA
jgi:glyoxylase-like metal-dependent hydrolase (beta-lactamase superfamily II)